jgi:opacity protein-like surface antigen
MNIDAVGIERPAHFLQTCGGKGTSKRCRGVKMAPQKIDKVAGAHVKKLLVASVVIAAVALSVPVHAADMPPYSVAKGAIVGGFDWEGFYVGGHVGGASDNESFTQTNVSWTALPGGFPSSTSVNTGESGSLGASSVTGGLQIGYNWLLPGPFLVGLEADISGAGMSSTTWTSPAGDPRAVASWNEKLDVYGSVRTRLGWVSDNWLLYGTGGFGWAYDKFTRSQLTAPIDLINPPYVDTRALQAGAVVTNSHVRPGWVAGAGVEWAFARTWTVKLEYLHFDIASESLTGGHFSNLGPAVVPVGVNPNHLSSSVAFSQGDLTIDTVRVGFNHTFN